LPGPSGEEKIGLGRERRFSLTGSLRGLLAVCLLIVPGRVGQLQILGRNQRHILNLMMGDMIN
jgi:hypothetical protein